MGALDAEKNANKEKLAARRNDFTALKREMSRMEEEESKAK
jgi:hypothetical protein